MLSFSSEKVTLSPRHPFTQIHGSNTDLTNIYTHTQWRKRKRKTSNPEQEDKVVAAALVVGE